MANLSPSLLGAKTPKANPLMQYYGSMRTLPATMDVVNAFVEEMMEGTGSLSADIKAEEIRMAMGKEDEGLYGPISMYTDFTKKELSKSPALSEEEWKQSEYFRDGLKYEKGMTQKAAQLLSEVYDDRMKRANIINRASGLQTAVGFASGFGAGVFEPKNLAANAAVSVATAGMGAAVGTIAPSVKRTIDGLNKLKGIKRTIAVAAIEGTAEELLMTPSNFETAKILQEDYGMTDVLVNIGMSVVAAGVIEGVGKPAVKKGANYVKRKITGLDGQTKIKIADTAFKQMAIGKEIDVDWVIKNSPDRPLIRKTLVDYNRDDIDFIKTEGIKTKEDIILSYEERYNVKVDESNIKNVISENQKEWTLADIKKRTFDEISEKTGLRFDEIEAKTTDELIETMVKNDVDINPALLKNSDNLKAEGDTLRAVKKNRKLTGEQDIYARKLEDAGYIKDGRITELGQEHLDRLGRYESMEIPDTRSAKQYLEDNLKNNNSTAYTGVKNWTDEDFDIDDFTDTTVIEAEINDLKNRLTQLQEQEGISKETQNLLIDLNNAEEEIQGFEDAVNAAWFCLKV